MTLKEALEKTKESRSLFTNLHNSVRRFRLESFHLIQLDVNGDVHKKQADTRLFSLAEVLSTDWQVGALTEDGE